MSGGAQQAGPWRDRYAVSGSVATTPGTLHLEMQVVLVKAQQGGGTVKCVADATGIFTASRREGVELEEARLGTHDLRELCTRGTRFFFTLAPAGFQVAFYDAQQPERKLGELRARALPVAGNPGSGVARWSQLAPALHHQPPQRPPPTSCGRLSWLLAFCKRNRKTN